MRAVVLTEFGGPEVLRWEDVELPTPGPGQAQVRQTAIGINYSDVNVRRGGFYLKQKVVFPVTLGNEAAGVVEAVGPGVTDIKVGDRVVTSGHGGVFPPGIAVGVVASVNGGEARVQPLARLDRLEHVRLADFGMDNVMPPVSERPRS